MQVDQIERYEWSWRYRCDCNYVAIGSLRKCELAQSIHRHRHRVGLAGIYHHTDRTYP